ncbi:PQQ-dependent sugar dehydrogenase [Paenibacillus sp. CAU 1782]
MKQNGKFKKTRKTAMITAAATVLAMLIAGCSGTSSEEGALGTASPSAQEETQGTSGNNGGVPAEEENSVSGESAEASQEPAASPSDAAEPYRIAAEGLDIPWSLAFDGDIIYISEREGSIVKVENGATTRLSVRLDEAVHHEAEGGFLGFVLSPDFASTKTAFAYHTYRNGGTTLNRIVELKLEGSEWVEQKALLEGIPGSLYHNGGRLELGPDGLLYATTGDATQTSLSQDKSSLAGKILRLNLDGSIPADNPTSSSYIYSYGHRNPQGVAWTSDGTMYSSEHGPSGRPGGHDEINLITSGANYGWPELIGDQTRKGMVAPLYHTGDEAIAPSGTIVDEKGRLLIAALVGEGIYRYTPSTGEIEKWHEGEGRIRDLHLKDGKLYFITNNRDGRGNPLQEDDRLIVMNYTN